MLGREPPAPCVFRVKVSAGVWSVTRNHLFDGDYLSRADALDGARAAARAVEALGGVAEVRAGSSDTLVPIERHKAIRSRASLPARQASR